MALAAKSSFPLSVIALALASMGAPAAPIDWANDTSGNWSLPTNWSPIGLPDSNSDVSITTVTGLKTITHDTGNDTIRTLTTNGSAIVTVSNGSSLQVNAGGTNGNTFRADNGAFTFAGGVLNNLGTLNAINNGTITFTSGSVLRGGTVATATGGQIVLAGSALLDGATSGAVTNTGAINVGESQTAYVAGTIVNNGAINVGVNADFRMQGGGNVALTGSGTVTLTDPNSRLFSDANGMLTIGAAQTVQGVGNLGRNQTRIANSGVITANRAGGTFTLDPSDGVGDFVNTGTLRAENGGTLQLITGTFTNAGANIRALAGSTVTATNGAIVQGGTLSTVGTGAISFGGGATFDGLSAGAITTTGNVGVGTSQTAFAYGVVNDNSFTIGSNADLRITNGRDLTLANGTLTLVDANSRLLADNGSNRLTNAAGNTIQGVGQIGVNQMQVTNAGVITANVAGLTLQLDPTDGTSASAGFINTGTLRAENGGNLNLVYGFYDNRAGTINATNGSTVTVSNSAIVQGGTVSATGTGAVNFQNNATLDGLTQGAMTLNGNINVASGQTVYALGTLNTNNLTIGSNADLRIAGTNELTLANNGTVTLTDFNSRIFGDNAANRLTNTLGNTIQGAGQIGINQAYVTNAGLITANVAGQTLQLDPSDGTSAAAGFINTGTLRAENAGNLNLVAGTFNNLGGTIMAAAGSTVTITNSAIVQGGTLSTSGTGMVNLQDNATLDGLTQGALNLNGNVKIVDGQTVNAFGTLNNLTIGPNADLRITTTDNLTFANNGTVTLTDGNSRIFGNGGTKLLTNTAGSTIQGIGQIGIGSTLVANAGLITANVAGQSLVLDPTDGDAANAGLRNTGILRAANGGNLVFQSGHYNNAGGTIAALNGSTATVNNGAILEGGLLTSSGSGAINVANGATLDGSAHGTLTNTGTINIVSGQTGYFTGAIANNGAITVGGNTDWRVAGGSGAVLSGSGTVTLSDGNSRIFGDIGTLLTIGAGQTVQGVGQLGINRLQLTNGGTIAANVTGGTLNVSPSSALNNQATGVLLAGNGGTLNLQNAVSGSGTIRSDSGGTVIVGMASTTGQLINNANLSLGTSNVTVSADYNNANFGTGNAFNKRANVTGTGQILASGNVAQAITGSNVTSGTTGTPTLTIGNVRVGGTTYDYQVANAGTSGPAIRGALQTGVNGGNITDSRLSGTGVTASNYGPVAAGANSGNLGVTFTATTAGALAPLAGQSVHVANNFDDVSEQTLNIALASGAAAYNAAVGSTTPSPVTVANQRVGGTNSSALTVANTATAGNFSEALNAGFGVNGGTATNNGGSVTNLAAGSSNNSALAVGVNTATAGARTGNVTIVYQTDGTGSNGHSGLSAIAAGSQTIAVSGNVYQTAAGNIVTAPFNFGTVQVGQTVGQNITVQNTATGAAGFVEDLNASFGAVTGTGAGRVTGTGALTGLVAGASSNALGVSVDTSTAGMVSASIAVNYFSAGTVGGASNGLGVLSVGSQGYGVAGTIATTANVVDQANPVINNGPIALGNVRIGATSPTGTVSVTNVASGNQQAALNASISGNAPVTASGSFNLLNPGATNNSSLAVGIDTSSAGNKSGTATLSFVSDASNIGNCAPNCQMTLASQNVAVTGAVYRLANPAATPGSVTVAGRVGSASPTTALSITNASPDIYTEGLTVTRGATSSGFTSSGSITNLAAGGSSGAIGVTLDTATAGTFSGTQALAYTSTGAGTTGAADVSVGSGSVTLNGKVYTPAVATLNTPSAAFGIVHVGDTVAQQNVSVTNSAAVTALNDTLVASASGATGPFTATGNLGAGLGAQQTSAGALKVGLDTTTAGVYSGTASFSAASHDADLSDAALASLGVSLSGQVNNYAADRFSFGSGAGTFSQSGSTYILDYGTVAQNSGTRSTTLLAGNSASGPADELDGTFQFLDAADFGESGFSNFVNLMAGQNAGPLMLSFASSSIGTFMDTITLHGVGHNASGYSAAIDDITLMIRGTVTGQVVPPVGGVPEPDSLLLLGLGLPLLFIRRGRASKDATGPALH